MNCDCKLITTENSIVTLFKDRFNTNARKFKIRKTSTVTTKIKVDDKEYLLILNIALPEHKEFCFHLNENATAFNQNWLRTIEQKEDFFCTKCNEIFLTKDQYDCIELLTPLAALKFLEQIGSKNFRSSPKIIIAIFKIGPKLFTWKNKFAIVKHFHLTLNLLFLKKL